MGNRYVGSAILLFVEWLLGALRIPKIDEESTDSSIKRFAIHQKLVNGSIFDLLLDFLVVLCLSVATSIRRRKLGKLGVIKIDQLNGTRMYTTTNGIQGTLISNIQVAFYGLRSIWKHLRFWILPLTIATLFIYYSFVIKSLPFSKVIFGYIIIANMVYLFISGFVFFIKKYQYRLFTSAIQRFWHDHL